MYRRERPLTHITAFKKKTTNNKKSSFFPSKPKFYSAYVEKILSLGSCFENLFCINENRT